MPLYRRKRYYNPRSIQSVASQSAANSQGLATLPPEIYIPLWWYSGAYTSSSGTSSNSSFVQKGSNTPANNTSSSNTKIHTLNNNWPATTQFAFEATLWAGATAYAALYDITAGSLVGASQISTTSTTATVIRSSQFTLTPGHQYGVAYWTSNTSYGAYLTDASLIVYPNAQMLASGDLANITLGLLGQKLTETQIPLWVYSSGGNNGSLNVSAGQVFAQKGSNVLTSASSSSIVKLHTLNSNWSATQRFAFEASIYSSNASGTAYAALWDFTSSAIVSGSQISTTSTTATLVRSGQFTLTPGHVYGITTWISNSSYTAYLTKAHLIPLFS